MLRQLPWGPPPAAEAAWLYVRQPPVVEVAPLGGGTTEFIANQTLARCEERLALAVPRPTSLISIMGAQLMPRYKLAKGRELHHSERVDMSEFKVLKRARLLQPPDLSTGGDARGQGRGYGGLLPGRLRREIQGVAQELQEVMRRPGVKRRHWRVLSRGPSERRRRELLTPPFACARPLYATTPRRLFPLLHPRCIARPPSRLA